jgi:alanine racemase
VNPQRITVTVDLGRVRRSAEEIRRHCSVEVLAVVKADGYGLGAKQVAACLADVVDGFVVFSLAEVRAAGLNDISKKPILAIGPHPDTSAEEFRAAGVRPSVWTVAEATRLRSADPVLSVDTGMNRFTCPRNEIEAVLAAGGCREAFTHATRIQQVHQLKSLLGGRGRKLHAAASSLLDEPDAWLDAVRPGLALYRGAVRVSTPLIEIRDGGNPAGYTGFTVPKFGIIGCGYRDGLRKGPCLVGGVRRRVLEVGMQSAYVEISPGDRPGEEVILLGDGLTEAQIAAEWETAAHEVLLRMARMGNSGPV